MRTIRTLMGCCVAIAAALPMSIVSADDAEGVALVSHCEDGICDQGICTDGSCGCDTGCCDDGCGYGCDEGAMRRQMRTLKYGWNGEANWCGEGGHCTHGCKGPCGHGRGWLAYKLNCLFGVQHGATHSPGHGYVLPVKRPIWDVSYPYNHMLNATSMGAANGQQPSSPYGNVYMPTDTTQLGYSYGHVPYWMPRAGMVPATPNPESYHLRVCLPNRCSGKCGGTCQACQQNGGMHGHGHVIEGPTMAGPQEVATEPRLAPVPQ